MKTIHKKNTTFLNLAAGLLVAALVLGCNTNVSNGSEVQPEKFTVTFNVNGGNGKLTATWSDTIKVQCQNCRKREEEGQ